MEMALKTRIADFFSQISARSIINGMWIIVVGLTFVHLFMGGIW